MTVKTEVINGYGDVVCGVEFFLLLSAQFKFLSEVRDFDHIEWFSDRNTM
jgi:hypothetical protein